MCGSADCRGVYGCTATGKGMVRLEYSLLTTLAQVMDQFTGEIHDSSENVPSMHDEYALLRHAMEFERSGQILEVERPRQPVADLRAARDLATGYAVRMPVDWTVRLNSGHTE